MLVEPLPPMCDDLHTSQDLLRAGRITAALHGLETAVAVEVDPDRAVAALASLLECRLARGELDAADRIGERLESLAPTTRRGGATTAHALGELASARGENEPAVALYSQAGERLGSDLDDPDLLSWRSGAALALTRLGRHREAAALAAQQLDLVSCTGSSYAVAHALRTVAATNTDGSRLRLIREARAALTGVVAERLAAQIDADLAVLLTLQVGPSEEAVSLLRSAEAYAGREDLFPLQQRVRRVLERLGEQPHRIRSESLASLTATEQKAARLAADGLTNREIAAQLDVTIKAVEWHLSHVYRKLGIRSRTSLPDTLGIPA